MKKLEELGISPTPWGFARPTKMHDANTYCDERIRGGLKRTYMFAVRYPYVGLLKEKSVLREQTANARLIAAAPELYEAAYAFVRYADSHAPLENGLNPIIDMARSALAKAAGESEVAK